MEKETLISIIVPVYNAAQYLEECLNSVLNQTNPNIEVVLINDGSTDESGEICRRYAEADHRIIFLSQENAGVAAARNRGMEAATGEYIMFADADDLLALGICEAVEKYADHQDVILFGVQTFRDESSIQEKQILEIPRPTCFVNMDRLALIRALLGRQNELMDISINFSSPWAKAYRRRFLISNAICFPDGISMGEDMLFNLQVYMQNPKVDYTSAAAYFYRQNEASAVHRYHPHIQENDRKFYAELKNILDRENLWDTFRDDIGYQKLNGLLLALSNDIFHSENPKSEKERKADFLVLVSREEYQSLYPVQVHRFGRMKQILLYLAIKKRFFLVNSLYLGKTLMNRIKKWSAAVK